VRTLLLALALVMAAPMTAIAAGSVPILTIANRHYTNTYNRDPAEVIETALTRRAYRITAREPGYIDAYYAARDVRADIRVSYTDSTYSITYVNSQNLRYTGSRIDAHYNHWVNNLDHDLQLEFAAPAPPPLAAPAPATPPAAEPQPTPAPAQ
jgi:hypothetical protein